VPVREFSAVEESGKAASDLGENFWAEAGWIGDSEAEMSTAENTNPRHRHGQIMASLLSGPGSRRAAPYH
jgi:hypothetical protein